MFDLEYSIEIISELLPGLVATVQATLLGMCLALALGLVWAIMRRSRNPFISWPAAAIVEFIRSTPLLVQLYFFFFALPQTGISFSPFVTGVLGLGLHYSSYTSEVYRAGIDGVARGQWEAARALNIGGVQLYRHVVLPQAIPPVVPALGNYLVAMFKDTPLLSAITVLELLQRAKIIGSENFQYLEPLTLVGVAFLIVSLIASQLVRWTERLLVLRSAES